MKPYADEIKIAIKAKGDDPDNVTIELVEAIARVRIILKDGYKVYFSGSNTLRECLGFSDRDLTTDGTHISVLYI